MNRSELAHHHVVSGPNTNDPVSVAHFGDLPTDFVVPDHQGFLTGDATEYGWEWAGHIRSVSGRPVEDAPRSRTAAPFGCIDIEGGQFYGPISSRAEEDDFGRRSRRRLQGRQDLLEVHSDGSPLIVPKSFSYGCFNQYSTDRFYEYTALALIPAVRATKHMRERLPDLVGTPSFLPVPHFLEAEVTFKGKFRLYCMALLKDPEYVPEDTALYTC